MLRWPLSLFAVAFCLFSGTPFLSNALATESVSCGSNLSEKKEVLVAAIRTGHFRADVLEYFKGKNVSFYAVDGGDYSIVVVTGLSSELESFRSHGRIVKIQKWEFPDQSEGFRRMTAAAIWYAVTSPTKPVSIIAEVAGFDEGTEAWKNQSEVYKTGSRPEKVAALKAEATRLMQPALDYIEVQRLAWNAEHTPSSSQELGLVKQSELNDQQIAPAEFVWLNGSIKVVAPGAFYARLMESSLFKLLDTAYKLTVSE